MQLARPISRILSVIALALVLLVSAPQTAHAATFIVDTTADTPDANPGDGVCDDGAGNCTLRAAIQEANERPGSNFIEFNIVGNPVIEVEVALPDITRPVVIDGYTQPNATPNTNPTGQGLDANLRVLLYERGVGDFSGLRLVGAGGSTVRGLTIWDFKYGIEIFDSVGNKVEGNEIKVDFTSFPNPAGVFMHGQSRNNSVGGVNPAARNLLTSIGRGAGVRIEGPASENRVQGNLIGTDQSGTEDDKAVANTPQKYGVVVTSGATDNLIGGLFAATANVISGNGTGVLIQDPTSTGNRIQGNIIGPDVTGASLLDEIFFISGNRIVVEDSLGNHDVGVDLDGAVGSLVGGDTVAARNVISGNGVANVRISGSGNTIQGNFVGTDVTGTSQLAGKGVLATAGASDNIIGGTQDGEGNVIAFNSGAPGVRIDDAAGTGNAILGNSVHSNSRGIDLGSDRATLNDPGDTDAGPNNLQNFPELESPSSGSTIVDGTLDSAADATFRLEFFSNAECDSSGFGQGESFIGSVDVTTDSSGRAAFSAALAQPVAAGRLITATATGPGNNTSEFSECVRVGQEPFVVDSTQDFPDSFPGDGQCNDGSGSCTLRAALDEVRALKGRDAIHFAIPGSGPHTIRPQSPLPGVAGVGVGFIGVAGGFGGSVVLDGYTQPGSSPNTNDLSQGLNTVLKIEINGAQAGFGPSVGGSGFGLAVGSGSVVRGLAINGFGGLATVDGSFGLSIRPGVKVEGNFIGTSVTGDAAVGNTRGGIFVKRHTTAFAGGVPITPISGSTIGGASPAAANLISGNGGSSGPGVIGVSLAGSEAGISLSGSGNVVQGNLIGTDITGTLALGNDTAGIFVGNDENLIGGPQPGEGNLISGNSGHGVLLQKSVGSVIQGNLIGTTADGVSPLGNSGSGVFFEEEYNGNAVGGTGPGAGNTIAFNSAGISLGRGSTIQTPNDDNALLSNSIFSNTNLGIDLDADNEVEASNPANSLGANRRQNYPELVRATAAGSTAVEGSLNSTPATMFRLEFFSNSVCDASGHGEGETYLGFVDVTTDADGDRSFSVFLSETTTVGYFITATATNPDNNTSEFSACVEVEEASPVTLTVNSANDGDDGSCDATHCSLREAINSANVNAQLRDDIVFKLTTTDPGYVSSTDSWTIRPTSTVPSITDPVVIDGYTQPGAAEATSSTSATLKVELDGTIVGAPSNGLLITGGRSKVRGLVINRFGIGVRVESDGSIVEGNFMGTDVTGTVGLGGGAVYIVGGSKNRIGGLEASSRNVISGNGEGVYIGPGSTDNVVQGNYIGTDVTGTQDLGNSVGGVSITNGARNNIGGPTESGRNVISGNAGSGVTADGVQAKTNVVQGNYIGTQADGVSALGNDGAGVVIFLTARGTRIDDNTIAFNGNDGVALPTAGNGNAITRNSIFANAGMGIDLGIDGVRANDADDSDTGVNDFQNYPVLTGVAPGSLAVTGGLTSTARSTFHIEFFASSSCDPSGYGEGARYLGAIEVTTDGTGHVAFVANLSSTAVSGEVITATATNRDNSTSEFSECISFFLVDSTTDTSDANPGDGACDDGAGNCTLRAAIEEANASVGTDTIGFNLTTTDPGYNATTTSWTIRPGTPLPTTTDPMIIDGYTQPRAAPATTSTLATLKIELDGSNGGVDTNGLVIAGGNSTVAGLTINRFGGNGIHILGNGGNSIDGNYIGTDVTGTVGLGNSRYGVWVDNAPDNTIGGASASQRNVISGNSTFFGAGVTIEGLGASSNVLLGNFIGTDVSGTLPIPNQIGVHVVRSDGNVIGGTSAGARNVISGNTANGVQISSQGSLSQGGENNFVQGNFIGTDVSGAQPLGNGANGISLINGRDNTIGGTEPGARNVISANGFGRSNPNFDGDFNGIRIQRNKNITGDKIQGNYIGTDVTGTVDLGNAGNGILIRGGKNNLIGGATPSAGNVISGNERRGILVVDDGNQSGPLPATGNSIQGNYIGTSADGNSPVGNGQEGVFIGFSVGGGGANDNSVGGRSNGEGNTIAHNGRSGVLVNTVWNKSNAIQGNSIHSNGEQGIELVGPGPPAVDPDTVQVNDPGDEDTGPNNLQNFPVFSSATAGSLNVIGALNSVSSTTYRLEFFSNMTCDASGHGEGETYIGFLEVTTDANGDAVFNVVFPSTTTVGHFVTATATDPDNNTSEFSACIEVQEPTPVTFTVNTTDDGEDGTCDATHCSLREAIEAANANLFASDTVAFNLTTTDVGFVTSTASWKIAPTITLPEITDPVIIDGYTQPGAVRATSSTAATLKIELDGSNLGPGESGLKITGGGTTVTGVVVNRISGVGIRLITNGGNVIEGNYVGTDVTGTTGLANLTGIATDHSSGNRIGGTLPWQRNVISGNTLNGVILLGAGSSGNVVQGNLIGLAADGVGALGNTNFGVEIDEGSGNTVGGTSSEAANKIAFNFFGGVMVTGGTSTANAILGNSIHSNSGPGIDLSNDGVTPNDPDDSDTGPNRLQNYPVLISVDPGSLAVTGGLSSTPTSTFHIEFFASSSCDPSGYGEGNRFLGAIEVTTDGTGHFDFVANLSSSAAFGEVITATATNSNNSTSEFSACLSVDFITVDSTVDTVDANPGDGFCADAQGRCTLRAAIMEANSIVGPDVIVLPAGTSTLTIDGSGENQATTGDLDITSKLTIVGAGRDRTTIDGNKGVVNDYVFHIHTGGSLTLTDATITNGDRSGLYNQGATLVVEDVVVSHHDGHGIYNNRSGTQATLRVTNSTIRNNGFDGIFNQGSQGNAFTTVINSTISNNSRYGILIANSNSTAQAVVINSTISGNASYGVVTGPSNTGISRAFLSNTTVANNGRGIGTGGATSSGTDSHTLKNTILANNGVNCSGGTSGRHLITSLGHNIISDASCPMFIEAGDQRNIDPLLGALADNGSVNHTQALLPGSPAIDAVTSTECTDTGGSPIETDQRGFGRPIATGCDIGSYEFGGGTGPDGRVVVGSGLGKATPEAGGTVDAGEGDVVTASVVLPAGAVSSTLVIGIKSFVSSDPALPPLPDGSAGLGVLGRVFTFSPDGIQFNEPVTLTISYTQDHAEASELIEGSIIPLLLVGGEWVQVGDCLTQGPPSPDPCMVNRDVVANTLTIETTHFSTYAFEAAPLSDTLLVNSPLDTVDELPDDGFCADAQGRCTLRAAIMEANVNVNVFNISVPAGTSTLTIAGSGEDQAMTGDLDITSKLTIFGAGRDRTTIDGNKGVVNDYVFHVLPGASLTLTDTTITNGDSDGLYNGGGTLVIEDVVVSRHDGTGILNSRSGISPATLRVTNSTISNNGGDGIYNQGNEGDAFTTVINSTISNNSRYGILISNSNSTAQAVVINSTISGNASYGVVTGPSNTGISRAFLSNTTVANNGRGIGTGGPTSSGTDSHTLKNTILANNGVNCSGGTSGSHLITSLGHNISSDASCPMFTESGDLQSIADPMLGALADNGGPTLTHALLPGSPAIDAISPADCTDTSGNALTADQRGYARPVGVGCDVGSFEFGAVEPAPIPSATWWGLLALGVMLAGALALRKRANAGRLG